MSLSACVVHPWTATPHAGRTLTLLVIRDNAVRSWGWAALGCSIAVKDFTDQRRHDTAGCDQNIIGVCENGTQHEHKNAHDKDTFVETFERFVGTALVI